MQPLARAPGLSVRLKLTLSYAGFLIVAGLILLGAAWVWVTHSQHVGLIFLPGYHTAVVREFAPFAAVALGFLLVFGLAGGWLLAGRMLAPLTRITDATRLASTGSLSHRIALEGPSDEFRELADAFDRMLERLDAHVAEQRRFAANASHELRTPLTITQTMLEVARKDPRHEDAELLERLQTVNNRAIELTEALLMLSRADQRAFASAEVDLSLTAEEAIETLLPLAHKNNVTIDSTSQIAQTWGSQALLAQMAINLIHNAIVHNVREGGTVSVEVTAQPAGACLTIENSGPAIDPAFAATLTEPFQRGTKRIHHDQAGVGLGLAVVQRIVEAHQGDLVLQARETGGLRVTVRLPALSS